MKSATLPVLSLCVLLASALEHNLKQNPKPCMLGRNQNAHETFMGRHVLKGSPESLIISVWATFLQNNNLSSRPIQSFLSYREKQRVDDVCTASGGKTYRNNLCISKSPFSFFTVRSNNRMIMNVTKETKHIILACNKIGDQCEPVHFEGNFHNAVPDKNASDCQNSALALGACVKTTEYIVNFLLILCIALLF